MKIIPNKKVKRNPKEGLKMLVFGQPNVGKTTFAAEWPNAIILNTDGNLGNFDTPAYDIRSWKYSKAILGKNANIQPENCFVDVLESLLQGDHDFDTLILEIGSHIKEFARQYILKKHNVMHEDELGEWGKGKGIVNKEFQGPMLSLFNSKYNVVIITHEKESTVKVRGKDLTYKSPDFTQKELQFLSGVTQITAHITVKEMIVDKKRQMTHILRLNPSDEVDPVGNKVNIPDDYMIMELGYMYDDLCGLIETNSKNIKIKGE